jgi:hypothetical protein
METIPPEMVISIFVLLDRSSIGKLCQLNKKFEKMGQTEDLWKQLTLNAIKHELRKEFEQETKLRKHSWKEVFRDLGNPYRFHSFIYIVAPFSWDPKCKSNWLLISADGMKLYGLPSFNANPAALVDRPLTPTRNYVEFKVEVFDSWISLGFSHKTKVMPNDINGKKNDTCALYCDENDNSYFRVHSVVQYVVINS